jgi:hypothetical protein
MEGPADIAIGRKEEPMQNLQRDHGVAGETHWLLDEELVPRSPTRVARPLPVLLRHDTALEPAGERVTEASAPSSDAFPFALGLLAAVAIYLLLRGADVGGALQRAPGDGAEGSVVVTATIGAELEGAEVAALRALLGRVPSHSPSRPHVRSTSPSTPAGQAAPKPPATEESVTPPQPPVTSPAPDPFTLLPEAPQPRKVFEDLERATGLEPATLSLEG